MTQERLTVAIIGCGQISEAHLTEIRQIADARLVAVCDLQEALAQDTAERHGVPAFYTDYREMLRRERPRIVHLTTPPTTHLEVGKYVLEQGCHLYLEKPCCTNRAELAELLERAGASRTIVCAGFSQLYDRAALRLRSLLDGGRLGEVAHVESYYGDSLDGSYSRLFLGTSSHWIHRLPGKIFQNVMTHALYHVVPLLPGEPEQIACIATDRGSGGAVKDEVRVVLRSGGVTAYITYTTAIRPLVQFLRVYGTRGIAELDFTNHLVSFQGNRRLPGPVARVYNAVSPGLALVRQGLANAATTLTGRDRFFAGMGGLFRDFYAAVSTGALQPPVAYEQVLRVAGLMDRIVAQSEGVRQ